MKDKELVHSKYPKATIIKQSGGSPFIPPVYNVLEAPGKGCLGVGNSIFEAWANAAKSITS